MHVLNVKIEVDHEGCSVCREHPAFYADVRGKENSGDFTVSFCLKHWNGTKESIVLEEPKQGFGAPPARKMRKRVQKQERRDAEAMGGRVQPNSGAMSHAKGDSRNRGKWRVDSKSTTNLAFPLHIDIITKIRSECYGTEKFAIPIEFVDKRTNSGYEKVVVVPFEWWSEKASEE